MLFYMRDIQRRVVRMRQKLWIVSALTVIAAASIAAAPAPAMAAPAVGDVYVYRVSNGYVSGAVLGRVRSRIENIGPDRIEVSLNADNPRIGAARAEIYARDGNWLRHQINNHDQLVDYEFGTAYPAYVFPLEPGKDWSLRVEGSSAASGKRNSIRVDGEVLGAEKVTVPAGTFETVKVRRRVYAGDGDGQVGETRITEIDWYAPALGRAVRAESKAEWMDNSRCGEACRPQLGDWLIYELIEAPALRP